MKLRKPSVLVILISPGLLAIAAVLILLSFGDHARPERLVRLTSNRVAEVSNVLSRHIGASTIPAAMPTKVRYVLSPLLDSTNRIAYLDEVTDGLCMVMPNLNCSNSPFLIHITNGHWAVFR
jgi:hypothetical protein